MIHSLLDTDFYKLTMMQVVLHQYASAWVRYTFKWRNWDEMHLAVPLQDFKSKLDAEIDRLCGLKFTEKEISYLASIRFFKPDFIEYDRMNSILDGDDYVPDIPLDRTSIDTQFNSYGLQLLDMCVCICVYLYSPPVAHMGESSRRVLVILFFGG